MSRAKREYSTYSRANYERFLAANKVSEKELPFKKYQKIISTCNWMFVEYALETGKKVKLPFGFGHIAINKKKLSRFKEFDGKKYVNLRVDWVKTKKEGKKIYHTNEHSDGFNYKWAWFNADAKIHLSKLFVFKPSRYTSRALAKYIKKPDSVYKEQYLEWGKIKYK